MPTDYGALAKAWDDTQALTVLSGGMVRFGWNRDRRDAAVVACKGPILARLGRARDDVPCLSFCTQTPTVRAALTAQTFTDWGIADDAGTWMAEDLAPFSTNLGAFLVVIDDEPEFLRGAASGRNFLLRQFVRILAASGSPGGIQGGFFVPLNALTDRPWLIRTARGLREDVMNPAVSGDGWRRLPFQKASAEHARMIACALPNPPIHLWAAPSSMLYGHEAILQRYVGGATLDGIPVPVRGKIQHGWQVGTGLDGELGFRLEVTQLGLPAYVWSSKNLQLARAAGMDAHAIGAPFLYLDDDPSVPAPAENQLLVFPTHSVPEYRVAEIVWRAYGQRMMQAAKDIGLIGATICLHPLDFSGAARKALESVGCVVTQLNFLYEEPHQTLLRARGMIAAHAAVTSDRVCTAGFYALLCNRPFFVTGPAVQTVPADPDEGPSGDPSWIAENFPTLSPDRVDRAVALRELGADNKRSPDELRRLLWGWLDG